MVSLSGLLALAGAGLVLWYWLSTLQARERAAAMAAETCRLQGVQFLDETVALQRLALARTPGGGLTWRRTYRFEYTETGEVRLEGFVLMLGARVEAVGLAPEDHTLRRPPRW